MIVKAGEVFAHWIDPAHSEHWYVASEAFDDREREGSTLRLVRHGP